MLATVAPAAITAGLRQVSDDADAGWPSAPPSPGELPVAPVDFPLVAPSSVGEPVTAPPGLTHPCGPIHPAIARVSQRSSARYRGSTVAASGVPRSGRRLPGSTSAGVLGYVDAVGGDRLVLAHLAGDEFGLLVVRDQKPLECIGRYSLSKLRRGDLGQVLTWNHQTRGVQRRHDDDDVTQEDPPCAEPSTRSDPAPSAPAKPERAVRRRPQPEQQAHVAELSATDLAVVDQHLTFDEPVIGDGATMVPAVFKGLRALVRLGPPNLLLYGSPLKRLMNAHGIEIHCCAKTFGRAMKLAAAQMQARAPLSDCLLIKVGRRWFLRTGDLRLVGSALLRCIATAVIDKAMSSPPAARTPAPADLDTEAPAPRAWGTRSFDEPPPAADPPPQDMSSDLGGDTREEISPPQVESQEAGATPHGAEKPQEFDLAWFLAQQAQPPAPARRRRLRDRPRIVTLASLPIHLSASQWTGVQTARGPPGEEDE